MNQRNRNYLFQYLEVIDQLTNEKLGYLGDLSKGGIMFISNKPLPLNMNIDISIVVNDRNQGLPKEFIKMQIQICWIKPNINPDQFCIGCQISQINPIDEQNLKKLGDLLSFNSDVTINRVGG